MSDRVILVTGFEPFGGETANPSEQLAKAVDGREIAGCAIRSATLPGHHEDAAAAVIELHGTLEPATVLHLGLAGGRARIALERIAVNVMDFTIPDNAGRRATGEPCVIDGPAAYLTTLPLRPMLAALTADGIPAYISDTAGTYLCNQTLYTSLHAVATRGRRARVGFIHLPLLPSMVAASGLDQPSMDFALMLRAVEITLGVIATDAKR